MQLSIQNGQDTTQNFSSWKTEKSAQFLRTRPSTDASTKMTQVLEWSDNDFKASTAILQTVKINTIEMNKKIDAVSREIEMFH